MAIARTHLVWIALCSLLRLTSAHAQAIQSREGDAKPTLADSPRTAAYGTAQLQLLEGVRLFRAAQYDEALRVFQKIDADEQPADIGFYLGMVWHKLGRHLPALIAFRSAGRRGLREPVADYYLAVSCYRLGMTTRARAAFATLLASAPTVGGSTQPLGPRLQQGARSFLATLHATTAEAHPDTSATLAAHYEQALRSSERLLQSDDPEGALEWFEEAARSLQETPDRPDRTVHMTELRQVWARLRSKLGTRVSSADVQAVDKLLAN